MNTVTVNASGSYDIFIGRGILPMLGEKIQALGAVQKITLVSDSTVFPLYGEAVTAILEKAGFTVSPFVFPAGEASKSGETYLALLNHMAQNQMTRTDLVAALGGGVVGDLAGFAAATYLRGIRFIQIPTTLLAAVDSSVGGKTAIDLPAGKNLAGAFCQPKLVVCDLDTLDSLPREIFQDGCAEVIKYGILYDSRLFAHLEQHGLDFDREAVITRCVELKRDVVEQDEFDTGLRMKLPSVTAWKLAAATPCPTARLLPLAPPSSPELPKIWEAAPRIPGSESSLCSGSLDFPPPPNTPPKPFSPMCCPTRSGPQTASVSFSPGRLDTVTSSPPRWTLWNPL